MSVCNARVWTSTDGKTVEAKFIRFELESKVTLEFEGNKVKFDIDRFSAADKKYLDELREILLANQPKEPEPEPLKPATSEPTEKPNIANVNLTLKARRIWRDRYGIGMNARFVRMTQGTVLFSIPGGHRSISYYELCVADREFILDKYTAMGKEALVPLVREGYGDSQNNGYDCGNPSGSNCGGTSGGRPNKTGTGSSFDNVPGQDKDKPEDGTKLTPATGENNATSTKDGGLSEPGNPLPPKMKLDIEPITENVLPATGFGAVAPKTKTVLPPNGFGAVASDSSETKTETNEGEPSGSGLQLPPFDSTATDSNPALPNESSGEPIELARNDSFSNLASSTDANATTYVPKSKIDFSSRFNQTPVKELEPAKASPVET
ncbi:MAG: hypothetical protein ACKVH8_07315 [Pirellulales bacterium]